MKLTVREMGAPDRAVWADMRAALWPEETPQAHVEGIDRVLGSEHAWGFIAEARDGGAVGFAEIVIRPYATPAAGSSSSSTRGFAAIASAISRRRCLP